MNRYTVFPNAPITEALLDIRVELPENVTLSKLEIPLPMKDFTEYILTVPEIAPKLPQGLANFFMRLKIPNPDIEAIAIITQTMENLAEDQRLPLIFDIDVFQNKTYSGNKPEMWEEFKKLRLF